MSKLLQPLQKLLLGQEGHYKLPLPVIFTEQPSVSMEMVGDNAVTSDPGDMEMGALLIILTTDSLHTHVPQTTESHRSRSIKNAWLCCGSTVLTHAADPGGTTEADTTR